MSTSERRARKRFDATDLVIKVQPISFFGLKKKTTPMLPCNFSVGGLAMSGAQKLKVGQSILLSLESANHRLQDIPAVVLRVHAQQNEYLYAVKFNLGYLSDPARKAAYGALQLIEYYLKSPPQAA